MVLAPWLLETVCGFELYWFLWGGGGGIIFVMIGFMRLEWGGGVFIGFKEVGIH